MGDILFFIIITAFYAFFSVLLSMAKERGME